MPNKTLKRSTTKTPVVAALQCACHFCKTGNCTKMDQFYKETQNVVALLTRGVLLSTDALHLAHQVTNADTGSANTAWA